MMTHRGSSSFDVSTLASQSPPDLRVRSEMWKGQIPVMFQLAPHEVTSMEDPPPLAVNADNTHSLDHTRMRQPEPSE